MAIETVDGIVKSLGNNSSRIIIDKASIASQTAGSYCSLWRATGQPGQGAIPATTAVCNNNTLGTINFAQQTLPARSYGAYLELATGNAAMTLELHDRLAHMGGLSGTLATAQTVNLDLSTLLATDNLSERKGDADYSDVQWWLEWYTATGATVVNATVTVTYNDGTTGALTVQSLAATRPASHLMLLLYQHYKLPLLWRLQLLLQLQHTTPTTIVRLNNLHRLFLQTNYPLLKMNLSLN